MRHFLFTAVLTAFPLWGVAGPANAPVVLVQGPGAMPDAARAEPNKDQRRAALRQALVLRQDAQPSLPEAQPARQLSPAERAELRRQLREQPSR